MGRQAMGGSGGTQENKRWPLIHGSHFLMVLLVISMIQVATSQNKMRTLDQGFDKIRSPRHANIARRTNTQSSRVCSTSECTKAANEIKRSMNLNANPCDDFYEYACGNWPSHNRMPNSSSYYSEFHKAESESEQYKKRKLETASLRIAGVARQILQMPSNLYKSCLNVTTINNLGTRPLADRITELKGWDLSGNWDENAWNFEATLLAIHKIKTRVGPVFRVKVTDSDDGRDSFSLFQAGPGLAKERYQDLTSTSVSAYKQLIIDVVGLLGGGDATTVASKADKIIRFEAKLANVSQSMGEWMASLSNKVTLQRLKQEASGFDWSRYLNGLFGKTIPDTEDITIPSVKYLKEAIKIIKTTPKSVLANYMVWKVIKSELQWLSSDFRNALLRYKRAIGGGTAEDERWKTCVHRAFYHFDDIISAAYVNEHQAQLARPKSMTKRIVREAIQAFKQNINALTWLDDSTKREAMQKIDRITARVSFPDYMLNGTKMAQLFSDKYTGLTIRSGAYFKNEIAIVKHDQQRMITNFRKLPYTPDNTLLWLQSPLHADVLYQYADNMLTVPAAVLKPPFLYLNDYLRAYNLGNLGSIAANKLAYSLDVQGRPYDKDGNQRNWWSQASLQEIKTRKRCFANQYSGYSVLGQYPINGDNTAENNIADNAALKIAQKAYYNWARQNPNDLWQLSGMSQFSNEQLFYIGFAQKLCFTATPEKRRESAQSWIFADDQFRVIGPLANSVEFANAFSCTRRSQMNPANRCNLW